MADRLNSPMNTKEVSAEDVETYALDNEQVLICLKGIRDYVVLTDRRLIMVDVKGTGKKISVASYPWSSVCSWRVESQGVLDPNSEYEFDLTSGKQLIFGVSGECEKVTKIINDILVA